VRPVRSSRKNSSALQDGLARVHDEQCVLLPSHLVGNSHWLTFRCPDGQAVQVSFEQQGVYLCTTDSRYSDGKVTFWNKGDTAMILLDDRILTQDCVRQPE
jgi:hypothetical protein